MSNLRTGYITARVEPKLKRDAQRSLEKVGLSTSDAITLFLRQVVLRKGLPFEAHIPHIPNAQTRKAMADAMNPKKIARMRRAVSTEEMFEKSLGKDWRDKYV